MPFAAEKGGVRLAVRLTPRASRNGLDGIVQGADGRPMLQLRLSAPPVEGAANKALIGYLAEALGLRKTSISIRSGETARFKILFIEGDGPALIAKLKDWVALTGG
ncbi:DUF167 domain-containing protein [Acidisoma cellulosilytica]|uniref:UPF0235 protein ACELLULO517_02895 n=1 Tax=Acidisoma cellulosilyticum TaxID=2802395 RepID=A0A964E2U4_9PROT|nr:DUF167 family protein [Acidisoma cellulosilyticum]MCB8879168.1 DUF167 domain-containing protein [Acidisoma cellulosilyticum]